MYLRTKFIDELVGNVASYVDAFSGVNSAMNNLVVWAPCAHQTRAKQYCGQRDAPVATGCPPYDRIDSTRLVGTVRTRMGHCHALREGYSVNSPLVKMQAHVGQHFLRFIRLAP